MTRPIPILFVITSSDLGGTESFLRQLATGIDRSRFAPHVCTLRPAGEVARQIRAQNVPVTDFAMSTSVKTGEMWRASRRLRRLASEQGTRLVQSLLYRANLLTLASFDLGRRSKARPILVGGQRSLGAFSGAAPERLLRLLRPRFDYTVAVSAAVRDRMIESEGLDPQRIGVIGNGVDTVKFSPASGRQLADRKALRASLGVSSDEILIGSAGRLSEKKRYGCLIEAVSQLRQREVPVRLCIAGEGEERTELERRIDDLGLTGVAQLLGPRSDLERLYHAFDVFVLPSREEGSPNSLIEAMASGVPTVSSRVGGIPEIVTSEQIGVTIEPCDDDLMVTRLRDQLQALVADPERRDALSHCGRQRVTAAFSCQRMIRQHEELYLRLLQGQSG